MDRFGKIPRRRLRTALSEALRPHLCRNREDNGPVCRESLPYPGCCCVPGEICPQCTASIPLTLNVTNVAFAPGGATATFTNNIEAIVAPLWRGLPVEVEGWGGQGLIAHYFATRIRALPAYTEISVSRSGGADPHLRLQVDVYPVLPRLGGVDVHGGREAAIAADCCQ